MRFHPDPIQSTCCTVVTRHYWLMLALFSVGILLVQSYYSWHSFADGPVDSDDALRLMIVRELASGKGWYDTTIERFHPPAGLLIHWSRYIDAGLVGLQGLLRVWLPSDSAEAATRFIWPILWIPIALGAVLAIAQRLGGTIGMVWCGVFLLLDRAAFIQFRPGRIDHHNVQIAFALVLVALALPPDPRRRRAFAAGMISGMVLAVSIEAVFYPALVGLIYAVRYISNQRWSSSLRTYAVTFAASALALYGIQTAPELWLRTACDKFGFNLLAPVAFLGVAIAVLVTVENRRSPLSGLVKTACLSAIGITVAGTCFALEPSCLLGPFGSADRQIWPIWLSFVPEIESISTLYRSDPDLAVIITIAPLLGLFAAFGLAAMYKSLMCQQSAFVAGLFFAVSFITFLVFSTIRTSPYAIWLAMALLGAILANVIKILPDRRVAVFACGLLVCPFVVTIAYFALWRAQSEPRSWSKDECSRPSAYRALAAEPAGLVMAPTELGSHVLAYTHHSVLSGPYHQLASGIITVDAISKMPLESARAALAKEKISYVVTCAGMNNYPAYESYPAESLIKMVNSGIAVSWLHEIQAEGELRSFRIDLTVSIK